jgi:hypothetical protein
MAVKKKYILLESKIIDVSTEFSPFEKKILYMLYKKYGLDKDFNMFEVAAELIEDFELDYVDAYTLTRTYSWNKRELFSEFDSYRKNYPMPSLFFENLYKLLEEFIRKNDFSNLSTKISFKNEDLGEYENRDVNVNTSYRGLYFYVPFPSFSISKNDRVRYLNSFEYGARSMSFEIDCNAKKVDGTILDGRYFNIDDETIDMNNFNITVKYKSNTDGEGWKNFMSFDVPYPQKLNKEVINNLFTLIMNDVLEKISNTKFNLPETINPINVDSQFD